jgi:hypothetical protein
MNRFQLCSVLAISSMLALGAKPAIAVDDGVTDDCTRPQFVNETNHSKRPMNFIVNITDKDNKTGGNVVMRIDAGIIQPGKTARVNVPPPGQGVLHCDAFNEAVALPGGQGGGPGDIKPGARQELKIEALFRDKLTNEVIQGSIADFMYTYYPYRSLSLPDLWADTDGDGSIADGDLLYSLVDINVYTNGGSDDLDTVNARYSPGESFLITNGIVADLPGFKFSTTSFTFDPVNGYQGTPYTGTGFAVTNHELGSPVPAPLPLAGSIVAFRVARRIRSRISSTQSSRHNPT